MIDQLIENQMNNLLHKKLEIMKKDKELVNLVAKFRKVYNKSLYKYLDPAKTKENLKYRRLICYYLFYHTNKTTSIIAENLGLSEEIVFRDVTAARREVKTNVIFKAEFEKLSK